jgi:hypothetical protein
VSMYTTLLSIKSAAILPQKVLQELLHAFTR